MKVLSILTGIASLIALLLSINPGYALTGDEILSKVDQTAKTKN